MGTQTGIATEYVDTLDRIREAVVEAPLGDWFGTARALQAIAIELAGKLFEAKWELAQHCYEVKNCDKGVREIVIPRPDWTARNSEDYL